MPPPPPATLEAIAASAPLMRGAEYLTPPVLRMLWEAIDAAFGTGLAESKAPVQEFLKRKNQAWNLVGRVHFNLAENRRDDEAPFAFLATYTSQLSAHGKAQHLPLDRALTPVRGQGDSAGTAKRVPYASSSDVAARLAGRLAGQQVGLAEEVGHEGGRRVLVDLGRRAQLLDLARVHHRDRVGHRHGLLLVVGDVHERDAHLGLDPLELDLHLPAQLQVERAERLVEQQHLRAVDQRAGQCDALLLAAGELRGPAPPNPSSCTSVSIRGTCGRRRARRAGAGRTRRSRRCPGVGRARSSGTPC